MIEKLVSATMLERGIDVYNLGIIPTPVVFRKAKEVGAGIIITSSHNPLEWNGLKFIIDGRGITEEELEIVKNERNSDRTNIGKRLLTESNYISDAVNIIGKLKENSACYHRHWWRICKRNRSKIITRNWMPSRNNK